MTPRTRAVVPVHLYGQPAAMDEIEAIARRRGLAVVADAAQAVGASYDGRPIAAWGDASTLSFYPTKNLGALRRRRHGPHDARRRRGARAPPARPRLLEEVRARRARLFEPARRAPGGAPAREAHAPGRVDGRPPPPRRALPRRPCRHRPRPARRTAARASRLPSVRRPRAPPRRARRRPRRARRGYLGALPDHLALPAALLPPRCRARLSPRGAGGDRDARPALLPGNHGSGDRHGRARRAPGGGGGREWGAPTWPPHPPRSAAPGKPWRSSTRGLSSITGSD